MTKTIRRGWTHTQYHKGERPEPQEFVRMGVYRCLVSDMGPRRRRTLWAHPTTGDWYYFPAGKPWGLKVKSS